MTTPPAAEPTPPPASYEHVPLVPPRLGAAGPPLPESWRSLPAAVSVADVVDLVGPLYLLDPAIHSLWPNAPRLVGRAVTVKAWPGDNLAIHAGLALAGAGDVVVVDWRAHVTSCGGGSRILHEAYQRGVRGIVIDGAWRDVAELAALGVPLFGRGECAYSPTKRNAGEIDVAVNCGGVVVESGDIIIGDQSGVVVVPSRHAEAIGAQLSSSANDTHQYSSAAGRLATYRAAFTRAHGETVDGRSPDTVG